MKKIIGTMLLGLTTTNALCMEQDPINAKTGAKDYNSTPLHMAIKSGCNKTEMIQFLIEERADLNAQDSNGESCVGLALQRHRIDTAKLLVESRATLSKEILERKFITGHTILHDMANTSGSKGCIEWLCKMGADLNAKTRDGKLPIHLAAVSGDKGNAEAILKAMREEQNKQKLLL